MRRYKVINRTGVSVAIQKHQIYRVVENRVQEKYGTDIPNLTHWPDLPLQLARARHTVHIVCIALFRRRPE